MAKFVDGGAKKDTYTYGTNHTRRGIALVFSIREFKMKHLKPRNFTDYDYVSIIPTLKNLGFEVRSHFHENLYDRTMSEEFVKQKLEEAANEDHSDSDCFLCVFLSYGYHGLVYTSDRIFPVEELQKPFKGDKCPSLAGKPKIFILQTCKQKPYMTQYDSVKDTEMRDVSIPAEADFLMFWSHIPNHGDKPLFYKPGKSGGGSIFIQVLVKTLEDITRNNIKEDFLHICVLVTRSIEAHLKNYYPEELEKNPKLLPSIQHCLTKDLYILKKEDDF